MKHPVEINYLCLAHVQTTNLRKKGVNLCFAAEKNVQDKKLHVAWELVNPNFLVK